MLMDQPEELLNQGKGPETQNNKEVSPDFPRISPEKPKSWISWRTFLLKYGVYRGLPEHADRSGIKS